MRCEYKNRKKTSKLRTKCPPPSIFTFDEFLGRRQTVRLAMAGPPTLNSKAISITSEKSIKLLYTVYWLHPNHPKSISVQFFHQLSVGVPSLRTSHDVR